jgi:hypothetical protein
VTLCSPVYVYQSFGGTYCLHVQDRGQASNQQAFHLLLVGYLLELLSDPEDGSNNFLRNITVNFYSITLYHIPEDSTVQNDILSIVVIKIIRLISTLRSCTSQWRLIVMHFFDVTHTDLDSDENRCYAPHFFAPAWSSLIDIE